MKLRVLVVALACAAAPAGCGSPASPTPTGPQAAPLPPPSSSGQTAAPGSSAPPGSIRIDAATVVEFQYPGHSGWYYAPQVRVTEISGAGPVTVFEADISMPGLNTWACSGGQALAAGQTRELFPEIYGDYPITFDKPGQRLSGDSLIVIRFGDGSGQTGTITVTAPITPGTLPTTYTGGRSNWMCG